MRGMEDKRDALFIYLSPEDFVPADHPLRPIRKMVDQALESLSAEFDRMYSHTGRPSIPPERLRKALILQALYSIRSNRMLTEQIGYSILFRWFLGMALDEPMWDHSSFTQNQQRLIGSALFFERILDQARKKKLLSAEHFTVDGTLLDSWASLKSFKPRDGAPPTGESRNPEVDFKGQRRSNETHASTTDPQAKLMRKGSGKEAKLGWLANVLMENRSGLAVAALVKEATGTAEQEAAEEMLRATGKRRRTVGADKGYDVKAFIAALRDMHVTPHIAMKDTSILDGRTTRHPGYAVSQRIRKRVEEIFGWLKTIALFRKLRYVGEEKVAWYFTLGLSVFNLVRMRSLGVAAS
ncbi:MAG: Transposase DDE domain protein [Syntrophaceae bacterium PtaU1.Bin231]|nr:MAG: Transposase DDE domain protein [Syntrophaceae bacterium PtaU1.Bin231]